MRSDGKFKIPKYVKDVVKALQRDFKDSSFFVNTDRQSVILFGLNEDCYLTYGLLECLTYENIYNLVSIRVRQDGNS